MTKPTYSELETKLERIKAVRGQHDCDCEVCSTVSRVCPASASSYALEIIGLRAENLRVRGLLLEVAEALNLPPETLDIASCNHISHVAKQARENAALYFQKWAEVRGLLQRLSNEWEIDPHGDGFIDLLQELTAEDESVAQELCGDVRSGHTCDLPKGHTELHAENHGRMEELVWNHRPPTFRDSPDLVSQGAESADIGKLDTADKKCAYCKHTHTFQFDEIVDDDCPVVGCPCMHFLGSAETGGENAAPPYPDSQEIDRFCKDIEERVGKCCGDNLNLTSSELWLEIKEWLPTFHRRSQNQTVSGGVEGAHEGTTADKSEPEKLNNAQKADELIDDLRLLLAGDFLTVKDRASARIVITKWLAESSLSSPPHLDDE